MATDALLAFAAASPVAVVVDRLVLDASGSLKALVVEYVNEAAYEAFRSVFLPVVAGPGTVGLPIESVLPADAAAEAIESCHASLSTRLPQRGRWPLPHADGVVTLEYIETFVPPDRLVTQYWDVTATERLATEEARSTALLERTFTASPDGLAMVRRVDDGYVVERANVMARALLPGLLREGAIAVGDPMRPHLDAMVLDAVRSGEPTYGRVDVGVVDGTVSLQFGASPVGDDLAVISFRDVTEEVLLQEAAREASLAASRARRLMYVALDSSPIAFTVYRVHRDRTNVPFQFTVEFVNQAATPPGRESRDVVSLTITEVYPDAEELGIISALREAADTLLPLRRQVEVPHSDGSRHYEAVMSRVDRDLVVSAWTDVTDLQRARVEAMAASQAKSNFLATVTHELRTPLTSMLGAAELLEETALDVEQRTLLERQRHSISTLLTLVNDILDMSRIEAGRLELENIEFKPRTLVRTVAEIVRDAADAKDVEVTTLVDDDVPPRVTGDPTRVQQILLNLASNAVKFTAEGAVVIHVRRGRADELAFTVRDTGIGIDAAEIDRLFSPFTQADASTTRRFGGTGLGLSITRRLTELMRGRMDVESTPGVGSTFTVELPLPAVDATTAPPAARPAPQNPFHSLGRAPQVLLAEDNDVNRMLLSSLLRNAGCEVTVARNGAEAVSAALVTGFDLVLMDVRMPEVDGLEATRRMRRDLLLDVPIIALTANATHDVLRETRDAGMTGFLTKPITRDDLVAAVAAACTAPAAEERAVVTVPRQGA